MKKIFLLLLCSISFIFSNELFADNNLKINVENQNSSFLVNTDYSFKLNFENISNVNPILLDSVIITNQKEYYSFEYQFQTILLSPSDKYSMQIKFQSRQNLTPTFVIYVYYSIDKIKQSFVTNFVYSIPFIYNDIYDSFTQNSKGLILKASLSNYVANHKSYTYKDARTYMFGTFDNVDGWVECVYTGEKIQTVGIPDVNTTHFNNEHTWPQSKGAENEPEKSDIFHMYPTNEYANSKRGDYPFGNVVSNITWSVGNSKFGSDKNGNTVFEPRDVHKGNVARSMFYFSIRYNNPSGYLNSQEETLRSWMQKDTVDAREMKRNDNIASVQGRRNPFIDHPEFLERIYSISKNEDYPPTLNFKLSERELNISSFFLEKNESYYLFITNIGNSNLKINSVDFENSSNDEIIQSVTQHKNFLLGSDSLLKIEIKFVGNKPSQSQEGKLIINMDSFNPINIPVTENYFNSVSNIEIDIDYYFSPNPTSDKLTLSKIPEGELRYEIFDYLGAKIQTGHLKNEIDVSSLNCGIYFLKINNHSPKKFIKL